MPHLLMQGHPLLPFRDWHSIPLATAIVLTDPSRIGIEVDPIEVVRANPWTVVAVVGPDSHGLARAWRRHPELKEMVELEGPEVGWATQLRRRLAQTGAPDPREVVDYIAHAVPHPTFVRALLTELLRHRRPARSARHSAFRGRGPLTAKGWMALYSLTRAMMLPERLTAADAAARIDIDARTLQRQCRALLGIDWRDARNGFGWRWAVERALRTHGYVQDLPAIPFGIGSTCSPFTRRLRMAVAG